MLKKILLKIITLVFFAKAMLADIGLFNVIGQTLIPEHNIDLYPENRNGAFVWPNERSPGFFIEAFSKGVQGGAAFSVGSFRSLFDFSNAAVDHLIMGDIDLGMIEFSRYHLELIKRLANFYPHETNKQRYQYVAALSNGLLSNKQLTRLVALDLIEQEKIKIIFNQAKNAAQNPELKAELQEVLDGTIIKRRVLERGAGGQLFKIFVRAKKEQFYWESDEQWLKITEAIAANRIAVCHLSLTEPASMEPLATALLIENIQISVMDVSNIPDRLKAPSVKESFINSINKLPIHDQASFVFSSRQELSKRKHPWLGYDGYWYYHDFSSASNFYEFIRRSNGGYL